jgi:hypothetical protein
MIRRWRCGAVIALLASTFLPAAAVPGDGAPAATEVRLPSVAIGKTYSTRRLSQSPFVIRNDGADTLFVTVQIGIPTRHGVCTGAQPLPDRSWVRLDADCLVVPPRTVRRTDVHLSLPYDPDLAGNTYQVYIWSTQQRAGRRPAAVRRCHRLLFRVEMDYRDDTATDFALAHFDHDGR